MKWTKAHHGLTHLAADRKLDNSKTWVSVQDYADTARRKFDSSKTWVSVQDHTAMACLKIYFPGCQFTPELKWFTTVDKAKAAGEKVMRRVAT